MTPVRYTAKLARNKFGQVIDTAQNNPVIITRHGKESVVIFSLDQWKQMEKKSSYPKRRRKTADEILDESIEKSIKGIEKSLKGRTKFPSLREMMEKV